MTGDYSTADLIIISEQREMGKILRRINTQKYLLGCYYSVSAHVVITKVIFGLAGVLSDCITKSFNEI